MQKKINGSSLVVAGSRRFKDYGFFSMKMTSLLNSGIINPGIVISGCANGTDTMAIDWARLNGFGIMECHANWSEYPLDAGFRRNEKMAEIANSLLVFWDGISSGTGHMVRLAQEKDIPYLVIPI
jgi:hypothetical protein